ncbi:MAG: aromatic ring-hydroxylating dioxygenase subunit alpha, partial [Rubrivivax sp.]|nr:aromatic ring-hydroxylating dioxygenase subunit alpha [Rubrivivax sp.]
VNTVLPDYLPRKGRHDDWGYSEQEQRTRTYLGMGEQDINVHDQWAVESMGAIQDRTREHLGSSDKVIMANRRLLLKAIETVREGGAPPMTLDAEQAAALQGPETIDCIAPAQGWQDFWQQAVRARRAAAPWRAALAAEATTPAS